MSPVPKVVETITNPETFAFIAFLILKRVTIYCNICGQRIKKLFSIDYANIDLFSIFFAIGFARFRSVELPNIAYIVIH